MLVLTRKFVFLSLLFACFLSFTFAQKTTVCYDLEGEAFPEESLRNMERSTSSMAGVKETDTTIEKRLFPRKISGVLEQDKNARIQSYLHNYILEGLADGEMVIIHYYPGPDECNSTGMATRAGIGNRYTQYRNKIRKKEGVYLLNIFEQGMDEGLERWDMGRRWRSDQEDTLKELFFEYRFDCFSTLVINSDGQYVLYTGSIESSDAYDGIATLKALE